MLSQEGGSSKLSESSASFTVLGAGVIGLMTANELASQGHQVNVIAREGQPSMDTDSTSSNAIGQFLPFLPEDHASTVMQGEIIDELDKIVGVSREFYSRLATNPEETGVMPLRNIELVSDELGWPTGLAEAMNVESRVLRPEITLKGHEDRPLVVTEEYVFDTFSINARKAVAYLANLAKEKGVVFQNGSVKPEDLERLKGIVINSTGLGALELTGDQDIRHYKGHTFVIRPGKGRKAPTEAISVDDLIIMPREDGTVIAGALYLENPSRPVPEEKEATELLDRLTDMADKTAHLVDGLEPELFSKGDILVHSSGYRVVIDTGGVRVVPDKRLEHVLHAYGFSGIGWSVGPSFARKIADQAVQMKNRINN